MLISVAMIGSWMAGDALKLLFFVQKNQPIQFIATAVAQLIMDVLILGQFYLYKPKKVKTH
jgi:hypothetical protein